MGEQQGKGRGDKRHQFWSTGRGTEVVPASAIGLFWWMLGLRRVFTPWDFWYVVVDVVVG